MTGPARKLALAGLAIRGALVGRAGAAAAPGTIVISAAAVDTVRLHCRPAEAA